MKTKQAPAYDFSILRDHGWLLACVRHWRTFGDRIVVAPGVWDLLGPQHLELLRVAATHGDILLVATPTDAAVRCFKGADRPIYAAAVRVEMLQHVRHVDGVVLYHEATPEYLLHELRPDVLVKGDVVGQKTAGADYAGSFVRVPLVDGRSTSATLQRIRQSPE